MSADAMGRETRGPTRPETVWSEAADCFTRWVASEDAGALDGLVRCLTPTLWHVARACGLDREEAEDVVQNTWLTLVRSRHSVRDAQAVGSWLTTATRREAWRVKSRAGRAVPAGDDFFEARAPKQRSAEAEAVEHEGQDRLWQAVGLLDERCKTLLRIVAFEARPDYAGIARDLGMAVGSVGPTRGRCLDKLKKLLEEKGAFDE